MKTNQIWIDIIYDTVYNEYVKSLQTILEYYNAYRLKVECQ